MLNVITLEEALRLIGEQFRPAPRTELIPLSSALGRILSEDILAKEPVPGFDRSTVDGFAVSARDTFGCSESIPMIMRTTALFGMMGLVTGSFTPSSGLPVPYSPA